MDIKTCDRILLHLVKYSQGIKHNAAPYETCRDGVIASTGIRRSHLSAILEYLLERGLIEEKTAHVKNRSARVKVYMVTQKGMEYMRRLEEGIGK